MGVPKFYRWISERYPCLSEVVREYQIPEFDNLYLDMNGIIHICSHPNDEDPHFRISEDKIFKDIFQYIEALFRLIRPRKVFFMAVDGVAPRAKMNQQRGRRFRSAREAEELEKKALMKGEILPQEERFDSNCITPGTAFMARLHEHLKYFVTMKISTDKIWRGIRVYLSGHETPGEGEHKIMEFIRSEKSKPGYSPNTRHCLYGLDADLIMLGLCTHEPHFSLLREEVQFGGRKSQIRMATAQETTFHLLHLSLMREYLDYEFSALKNKLDFEYDLEKIIDDWVLMGFLVGNDFIPHLPQMHIAHDALPLLYNAYKDVLPKLDGYINEGGYLNISRFETYLKRVALIDYEYFNDNYTALAWFNSKTGRKLKTSSKTGEGRSKKQFKMTANVFEGLSNIEDEKLQDIDLGGCTTQVLFDTNKDQTVQKLVKVASSDDEDDNEEEERDMFEMEFRQHKRDYYMNKLDYPAVTSEILQDQAECYVRAIQWNLHYYYNGVCSWSWFYPHHYAPYISDIKNFSFTKIEFDMGKPFLPFEQLLAVLPAASKKLLPVSYQNLMITESSPLIDYYPLDFKTDLNGKLQDWEAVVLIPFINESQLLDAIAPLGKKLTDEEARRNRHGPCLLYTFSEEASCVNAFDVRKVFPEIQLNYASCKELTKEEFDVDPCKLHKGLCDRVRLDVHFPGFPTLKHIPHSHELKKASVKVFQMPSRNENMLLRVKKDKSSTIQDIAARVLGGNILVSWPHLTEAKVIAVSDQRTKISVTEEKKSKRSMLDFKYEDLTDNEMAIWQQQCDSITERCIERFGIVIDSIDILIFACPLMGRKYVCSSNGRVSLEKQWTPTPLAYAHQLTVAEIETHDPTFKQFKTMEELFIPQSPCFTLGHPHYGSFGQVVEANQKYKGLVTVELTVCEEPDTAPIIKKQHLYSVSYMPGYTIAQRLGIGSHLLSRMTGTLFVSPGSRGNSSSQRVNVGLNLKFNKKNKEVPGYTKKGMDGWLYSTRALDVMAEYIKKFPELFEFLARNVQEGNCYADDIFAKEEGTEKLQEIQSWLKSLPCASIEQKVCGTEILDEPIIGAIEEAVEKIKKIGEKKKVFVHTKPSNVFLPHAEGGCLIPDSSVSFRLFDRVINVREGFSVPLGLRGTLTGIHLAENEADTLYDVVFDDEFLGGIALRCSANKGCKMSAFALINLSHGARCENQKRKSNQKHAARADFSNVHTPSRPQNNQLNRINHSPNSPFVPQQTQQQNLAKDNCEDQQADVDQTTDEFFKMWQQLQSSAGSSKVQQVKEPRIKSISLQKAAKKLPQRITMQATTSFKHSNQSPNTTSRPTGKSVAVSEFGGFFQTLEASKSSAGIKDTNVDKFSADGTAALIQMLHIENGEERDKPPLRNDNESILQETKLTALGKTKSTSSVQTSNAAYSQHQSCGPSPSYELLNLVQRLFGTLPLYHYTQNGLPHQQYFLAQVTLPNGVAYHSVPCSSKREACDSAAMFALEYLKTQIQIPPPMWRMAPPLQSAIPQSIGYGHHLAFDPNMNIQSLPVGQPHMNYGHSWGRPPLAHAGVSPAQYGTPLAHLEQSNFDVGFAMNNRFVPMQVTVHDRMTKRDSWNSVNQTCEATVGQTEQTVNGKKQANARTPPKKSRQPRLAARFDYCS